MRTENLAVMFTDVQGFTATTARQTRDENALFLRRHDALLLPVVRAFGGRRVKAIGDAWLVVFRSPTNSVLCGMAIQDRLWDYNRRVPEGDRIRVRVAVNLGEVRVARSLGAGDVFGEPVNIAARVEGEAAAGEVLFTEAVHLAMNKAEVPAEEVGYRSLKGVPEPVRLYRAAPGRYALRPTPAGEEAVEQPPFGNHALGRLRGLAAPDPGAILRRAEPRPALSLVASRLARAGSALPERFRWPAAALVILALAGGGAFALGPSRTERLIDAGRLDEARAAIAALAGEQGEGAPEVLWLEARLEHERFRRGRGSEREALRRCGLALAAGSGPAARELERSAVSPDCDTRRLSARALADARSDRARRGLRLIAGAEPEAPGTSDAVEQVKRLLGAGGRCGAGDIARDGLRALEAPPR